MSKLDQLRALREIAVPVAKAGKRPTNPSHGEVTVAAARTVGATPATAAKSKGRPLDKDRHKALAATQPWKIEGISRSTWFRRRQSTST